MIFKLYDALNKVLCVLYLSRCEDVGHRDSSCPRTYCMLYGTRHSSATPDLEIFWIYAIFTSTLGHDNGIGNNINGLTT